MGAIVISGKKVNSWPWPGGFSLMNLKSSPRYSRSQVHNVVQVEWNFMAFYYVSVSVIWNIIKMKSGKVRWSLFKKFGILTTVGDENKNYQAKKFHHASIRVIPITIGNIDTLQYPHESWCIAAAFLQWRY